MRQVLTLHIGGCGNRIGQSVWERLLEEHSISADGILLSPEGHSRTSIQTYFRDEETRHVPRAVMVDVDCDSVDRIRAGKLGRLFSEEQQVTLRLGGSCTFANGHYGAESSQLCIKAMEAVRRQVEDCDSLECVQITHSTTGGTGSGLQSKLISDFACEYLDRIVHGVSIVPSSVSNSVLDVYNFVLSLQRIVDSNTITNFIQNESLSRICSQRRSKLKPTFRDMNSVVSQVVTGLTLPMRFPGSLNSSPRKVCTNLIPFPRLHFLTAGITSLSKASSRSSNVEALVEQAYNPRSLLTETDWHQGKFFATANIFSNERLANSCIEEALAKHKENNVLSYIDWIADNIHIAQCRLPQSEEPSLLALMNSTSIRIILKRLAEEFTTMYRRRAFVHSYIGTGMDDMEFTEAQSNLNDLVCEFPQAMYYMGDYDDDEMDYGDQIE